MGTKNDPGHFDCYAAAEPDEPMFVLLGRDKHAPLLVMLWALLRQGDGEADEKIEEALKCADAMCDWRLLIGKPLWNAATLHVALLHAATARLDAHPEGYEHPCLCSECRSYT